MNECSRELNTHLLMMKRPLETDHSCVGPGPPSKRQHVLSFLGEGSTTA